MFALSSFGNQLFWFRETFFISQVASSEILGAMATKMVATWKAVIAGTFFWVSNTGHLENKFNVSLPNRSRNLWLFSNWSRCCTTGLQQTPEKLCSKQQCLSFQISFADELEKTERLEHSIRLRYCYFFFWLQFTPSKQPDSLVLSGLSQTLKIWTL